MSATLYSDRESAPFNTSVNNVAVRSVSFLTTDPRIVVVDWQGSTWDASDESTLTVVQSGLRAYAQGRCLRAIATMRRAAAEECVVPTDDDGLTMEFTRSDHEVTLVVPDDARLMYFVARGPQGFRRAGVVADDSGITRLAAWLQNPETIFPADGLVIADHTGRRR